MGGSGSTARQMKEVKPEKSEAAKHLDEQLGKDRPAIGYKDRVTQEAQETINQADALSYGSKTKIDPKQKVSMNLGKGPTSKSKKKKDDMKKEKSWRKRVLDAKEHAALTLSVVQAFGADLKFDDAANFVENMPFFVVDRLGKEKEGFVKNYAELKKALIDAPMKIKLLPEDKTKVVEETDINNDETKQLKKKAQARYLDYRSGSIKKPELPARADPKGKQKKGAPAPAAPVPPPPQDTRPDYLKEAEDLLSLAPEEQAMKLEALNDQYNKEYETALEEHGRHVKDQAGVIQTMVNRCNSRGLPDVEWSFPNVHDTTKWVNQLGKEVQDQVKEKRDVAIGFLKSGDIAVQVLAAGSSFRMPDNSKVRLWNADPYFLAEKCLGKYATDHMVEIRAKFSEMKGEVGGVIEGLTLGVRHMLALVQAVHKLGGDMALAKFTVVVHCSPELEQTVLFDFRERNYFGLKPENVIIVVQPRMPGYEWSTAEKAFVSDNTSPLRMYGTGFAYQQLQWEGEAYCLGSPGVNGQPGSKGKRVIAKSVLDYLKAKGVEWLLSNRLNDINRLHPDHAIELNALMHTMRIRDDHGVAMSIMVEETKSEQAIKDRGGICLSRTGPDSVFSEEITADAVLTPDMYLRVEELTRRNGGRIMTTIDKYFFHLPTLEKVMEKQRFVPYLRLQEWEEKDLRMITEEAQAIEEVEVETQGNVAKTVDYSRGYGEALGTYPFFDMSDLSHVARLRCIAVKQDGPEHLELKNSKHIERAMDVIYRQDSDLEFHKLIDKLAEGKSKNVVRSVGVKPRFKVLVFCQNDAHDASKLAMNAFMQFLKPGVDHMYLVHIVSDAKYIPKGQRLLNTFEPDNSLMHFEKEVLIRPIESKLTEFMNETVMRMHPDFVVMGSESLANFNKNQGVGSIAKQLSLICRRSMFIYKAGSHVMTRGAPDTPREKVMLAAHQSSLGMLRFWTKMLQDDDQLVIGRVTANRDQEEMSSKIIEEFNNQSIKQGIKPFVVHLRKSKPALTLTETAKEEGCTVLSFQVAQHLEPPPAVIEALKETSCALLLFKEKETKTNLSTNLK